MSRYDSRTTMFSPEGRVFQVEYAMEAINNGGATIGIVAKDGIVLAAERLVTSKLLDQDRSSDKLCKVDQHVCCAVAGLTADANILLQKARLVAQRNRYTYGEPMAIEDLVVQICDEKHSYTQYGGLRPFGVSFLFAGWDKRQGYQLYSTDPAGNFSGWRATAIGKNSQTAQTTLQEDWNAELDVEGALSLAAKVFNKCMDSSSPEGNNVEFAVLKKSDYVDDDGNFGVVFKAIDPKPLLDEAARIAQATQDTQMS
eukprot:GDKJ01017078.1.p1 GENE.GDKJ01017078.1~~GDKJ01017078.1.p1  ORF type:complete len:256 (-),score=57.96 GDKJ01017078.1:48-815(-)